MNNFEKINNTTEAKEEKLNIKEIKIAHDNLPGLTGRGHSSGHGSIEFTRGLILNVKTDKGILECLVLLALYEDEAQYSSDNNGWRVTDIKLIKAEGRSGTFLLSDELPYDSDNGFKSPLSDAIDEYFINDKDKYQMKA